MYSAAAMRLSDEGPVCIAANLSQNATQGNRYPIKPAIPEAWQQPGKPCPASLAAGRGAARMHGRTGGIKFVAPQKLSV